MATHDHRSLPVKEATRACMLHLSSKQTFAKVLDWLRLAYSKRMCVSRCGEALNQIATI